MIPYGDLFQGIQPPTDKPRAVDTNPHAVGLGIKVTPTAAKKKKSAAIAKKILPMVHSLKCNHAGIRRMAE